MPTAGRLFGAITFGILAWCVTAAATPYFIDALPPEFWQPLSVGIGIFIGWTVVGKRTGLGYRSGFGNGITGAVVVGFWLLFVVAFEEMIVKSMRGNYDGVVDSLVGVFELMLDFGIRLGQPEVGVILFVGGVIAALSAEIFAQRYP